MENNEQWISGGNCNLCRRKNYCSKPCTLAKRKRKAMIRGLVADAMNQATGGAMQEIIDRTCRDYI